MPMKGSGEATEWREIDRRDHGVGWLAYPDEKMQRASHAVEVDGDVYVIDPVDVEGLDDLLGEFGDVAGVCIGLDRHKRDSAKLANRHDVPVYVPDFFTGVEADLDAPVERVHREIDDTGIGVHRLVDNRFWQEAAFYDEDHETLVVPEAVGTADYFLGKGERLGVHPMLRLKPPRKLKRFDPERVVVGHGAGVREDAVDALEGAVGRAWSKAPSAYGKALRNAIFG
jgi:hypothetical protein